MEHNLQHTISLLARTPEVLNSRGQSHTGERSRSGVGVESPSIARNVFGKRFAGRRPVRLRTPRTVRRRVGQAAGVEKSVGLTAGDLVLHSGPNDPCVVPVLRGLDLELCSVWR